MGTHHTSAIRWSCDGPYCDTEVVLERSLTEPALERSLTEPAPDGWLTLDVGDGIARHFCGELCLRVWVSGRSVERREGNGIELSTLGPRIDWRKDEPEFLEV